MQLGAAWASRVSCPKFLLEPTSQFLVFWLAIFGSIVEGLLVVDFEQSWYLSKACITFFQITLILRDSELGAGNYSLKK